MLFPLEPAVVAAALAYARRGEVAAAIVYRTETRGIGNIVVLDEAAGWAPRAEVVAAALAQARAPERARAFVSFLAGPEGQAVFLAFGFGPP